MKIPGGAVRARRSSRKRRLLLHKKKTGRPVSAESPRMRMSLLHFFFQFFHPFKQIRQIL